MTRDEILTALRATSYRATALEKRAWVLDTAFNPLHGDGCHDWPWGTGGAAARPRIRLEGKSHEVHNLVCTLARGDRPDGFDAAHTCDRPVCCAAGHLRWVSRARNVSETHGHGVSVTARRRLVTAYATGAYSQRELSRLFPASVATINRIIRGTDGGGVSTQAEREADIR